MMCRCASWVLALAAVGCTAGTGDPSDVGFVLLDREARAAGQLSHESWHGAPLLPVALDVSEPVVFTSTAGRVVLDLRPGALAYVHGAGGAVEWLRVGEDIGADRLRVYGTKEMAADLAKRLAGRVEGGSDGLFTISAPDLLERASFLDVPEGIVETAPDRAFGVRGFGASSTDAMKVPPALLDEGDEAVRTSMLVGVYASGKSALILDTDGGFSIEDACSGDAIDHGRYRVDGERIVLDSDATSRTLTWESGALRDAAGLRLAPVLPPQDPSNEPGGEP